MGLEIRRAKPGDAAAVAAVHAGALRFHGKTGFVADGASKPAGTFGSRAPGIRTRRERHA